MSTTIRTEISTRSPYYVEKNRYLELKYFCLQYPSWKAAYASFDSLVQGSTEAEGHMQKEFQDPVGNAVLQREFYCDRIAMLEQVAYETDPVIGDYILKGVTLGLSYEILNAAKRVPCCRQVYYELYRRFFWLLDKVRR